MKHFTIFLFAFLLTTLGFAQGHETFDGFSTSNNSYQSGTFTGQDGSEWEYIQSRGDADAEITEGDQAIMLGRNRTPNAELISGTLQNGIGTLEFSYMQAFSSNVGMEVYVNDILVYTATSDGQVGEALSSGEITVNIDGDFVLRFYNPSGAGQVNIDDVIWTATGDDPTLNIYAPSNGHAFAPGTTSVDIQFNISNFTVNSGDFNPDGDGYILYSLNSGNWLDYYSTDPITLEDLEAGDYSFTMKLVDNDSNDLDVSSSVDFTILGVNEVSTIAELRQGVEGEYYTLTGEAVMTFEQNYRNQKYLQDATGAILVDDAPGVITTSYNRYDGITGITGKLASNNGILEIQPTSDSGEATSSDNFINPVIITVPDLMNNPEAYESQLVAFLDLEFEAGDGDAVFATGTNYNVSDLNGNNTVMRTNFFDADYIGELIPQGPQEAMVGLAAHFNGSGQFFIRDNDDLIGASLSVDSFTENSLVLYPNPTSSYFNLQIEGQAQVEIFSLTGQRMMYKNIVNESVIAVDQLPAGVYLVRVNQQGKTFTQKLVIK